MGCFQSSSEVKTTLKVSGAFALAPMMSKWADEYQKLHPDVRIDINPNGAGKGMTETLAGVVDIGMISREIDPAERKKGAYPIMVATDAVLVIANAEGPDAAVLNRSGLSKAALGKLFLDGEKMTWTQLGGNSPKELSVYTRADSCGAAESFAKYLNTKQEGLKGVGVLGDPGIVKAVADDKNGIAYANLNFAYSMQTGLPQERVLIVPLDLNSDGVLSANESFYADKKSVVQAISDGRLPKPPARDLYIVAKERFSPPARAFVRWILTDGQKYADEAGYVPLTAEAAGKELTRLGA